MENTASDNENGGKLINIENLRTIIKNIAICHSEETSKEPNTALTTKREFNIFKTAQKLRSLKFFNGLNQDLLDNEVKALEDSVKVIMDSSSLAKDQGIRELVPLPYEVLSLIFVSTDEKFRQNYLHDLMEYYYHELCDNMKNVSNTNSFVKEDFDQQVKVLLPIVKLETALKLLDDKDLETQRLLQEIRSNISSFIICPRINQEDIYAVVTNMLGSKNYELLSYEMIPLDVRNGHLGDYFQLKINVEFENTDRVLNLFAKFLTPSLEKMKEFVKSGPSKKEEFFYMTLLPFLEKHGLHSLLDFSPRCYFSRLNDVLVLDDMACQGFTALTPNIKLEFDGLMFVVKQIAKFHSCSIILEVILSQEEGKNITLNDVYEEYLKEVLFITDNSNQFLKDTFESGLKTIHYLAQKFAELNKNLTDDEFIEKIDRGWELLFKQLKRSERLKNAICHGDMYVSNMLFKFDTQGACQGASLIDFQILRYCPPVHDLLFFIYQNSFKETRDKYYRQLVDEYYLEISKHLENFKFDIAKIYPKEEFEESLNYMKSQAIFQALYYSPFNMLDPSLREELMQNKELSEKYFSGNNTALVDLGFENEAYRKILKGLIADIVELCESGLL